MHIEKILKLAAELYPVVQYTVQGNSSRSHQARQKGKIPSLQEGNFVSVACNDFKDG